MKKKVLVGMSGGVDSSVSAILLKEQGYEVIGATMQLWKSNNTLKEQEDARKVCDKLGIKHYVFDATDCFRENVINDFINCYNCAQTPNPCIECNKNLKFGYFYEKAKELNCEYIATGHYANVEYSNKYKTYVIRKSKSRLKDQTYVLYGIKKEIIPYIIFPLGNFELKDQIRQIAQDFGISVANKPDSQEICFIPDNDYVNFLKKQGINKNLEGNIVHINGEILGKHKGIINYTIGQRKGLGISYKNSLYVVKLDIDKNEVIVGEENYIFKDTLYVKDLNMLVEINEKSFNVKAKIRYSAKEADAQLIHKDKNTAKVVFNSPQRAITPGQSVVFYDDDGVVLGGGKIQ